MASPRNALTAKPSNAPDDARHEDGETRPMWLTVSGVVLALVVSIGASMAVFYGLSLPGFTALPLTLGWAVGQVAVNLWATASKPGDAAVRGIPARRVILSVTEGLVVAAASTLWFIGGGGISTPVAGTASAEHDLQLLRDERTDLQSVLDRRLPSAVEDPEAARLQRQVTAIEDELRRADREVLCELDGTCGTRVAGRGLAYYKKVDYRDGVKRDLDRVSAQLEARQAELTRKDGQLRSEQGTARTRATEIDRWLVTATPRRDQPTDATVKSFFNDRGTPFLAISFGVFIAFIVLDLLLLALLLRLGRPRGEQWNLGVPVVNGRAERGIPWHRYIKGRNGIAAEPEDETR